MNDSYAVVGFACRLPGGIKSPEGFLKAVAEGQDLLAESLRQASSTLAGRIGYRDPGIPCGYLANIECFDYDFFAISKREARSMDPQQRLLLMLAYEALDDAGIVSETLRGSHTGVFLGLHSNEYAELQARCAPQIDPHLISNGSRSGAAGRISYIFGLEGPSMVIDSDRSSSLAAIHEACQSMDRGECAMALVGGANLILLPELTEAFQHAGMLAGDGKCKFASSLADGFVRSEGVVVTVLKPLSKALEDHDQIYATIISSALKHSGGEGDSFLTPSVKSQVSLLEAAYGAKGLSPSNISYIEAHGTGTPIGDQVELTAIRNFLETDRKSGDHCYVGSVKTNVGHTEAAAGLVGLMKLSLMLRHKIIPQNLHGDQVRRDLDLENSAIRLPTSLIPWQEQLEPRIAGVSSFGLTGTNVHVVLKEAPGPRLASNSTRRGPQVLVVTGKNPQAREANVHAMLEVLGRSQNETLAAICREASLHRTLMEDRLAVVASTHEEMANELAKAVQDLGSLGQNDNSTRVTSGKTAFVFSGYGGQWRQMGHHLFHTEPVFRATIEACDEAVRQAAGWSLIDKWWQASEDKAESVAITQPAMIAVSIGVYELLGHWGIRPDGVMGASVGELAAAYASGVLSLGDTFKIVCQRSELLAKSRSRPGKMLLIEASADEISKLLGPMSSKIDIAAFNGPRSTVVSGDDLEIESLAGRAEAAGLHCRQVASDVAGHSPLVDEISEESRHYFEWIEPHLARKPMVSTVTGQPIDGPELTGSYWARQIRAPVNLMAAVECLAQQDYQSFIEISPHPVLWSSLADTLRVAKPTARAFPTLIRHQDEQKSLLTTVASLFMAGHTIDWNKIYPDATQRSRLPTYQWQATRCWFDREPSSSQERLHVAVELTEEAVEPMRSAEPRQDEDLITILRKKFARVIGHHAPENIEAKRPFLEMGLTSLMISELRHELEKALEIRLSTTIFFNYPTIEQLASFLSHEKEKSSLKGKPLLTDPNDLRKSDMIQSEKLKAKPNQSNEPLAIVGLACHFPKSADLDQLWNLLCEGGEAIQEVPADRWNLEEYHSDDPNEPGKTFARWGGFIQDVWNFDATFFGISPREAEAMDPQQRLLLRLTWESLENAGIAPESLKGSSTGIFVGVQSFAEYARGKTLEIHGIGSHDAAGDSISMASGRIAYTLGTQGPAVSIDTACSSSLVALHYACQSLWQSESRMAIAGGVNVILAPEVTMAIGKARMLSPTGRCRTFDAKADGYVRGEGCAMLVVKRLSDALADGDRIHALIRGTAVNQDGKSSGLTAPNGKAQEALLRQALRTAGLNPSDVNYLEAHGTGTPLGDPIEYQAIAAVFGEDSKREQPIYLGSVKANIGHLESASGIAGLVKAVLALKHKLIPQQRNLESLNPEIMVHPKLCIPVANTPLTLTSPMIAGVNSFGFSGTNAHVILEAYEPTPSLSWKGGGIKRPYHLLTLSAKTPDGLKALCQRYAEHLATRSDEDFADICYSSQIGRTPFKYRLALVASDRKSAERKLRAATTEVNVPGVYWGNVEDESDPKLAFLFSGQGSHYAGMGKELFRSQPSFRKAIQQCAEVLFDLIDQPLEVLLFENEEFSVDPIHSQVAQFSLAYALAQMWLAWGVKPSFVMGHSLGEYAAACAANVLSVEDTLKILVQRGQLVHTLPDQGRAAAVWGSATQVGPVVAKAPDRLSVAAINGPQQVLVTGEEQALLAALEELAEMNISSKLLDGIIAVHSPLMEPMLAPFEACVREFEFRSPAIPFVSTVTGRLVDPTELCQPQYWRQHVRQPVLFKNAIETLDAAGVSSFLEIGPHLTLSKLGELCVSKGESLFTSSLNKQRSSWEQVLSALGQLFSKGVTIDWNAFYQGSSMKKVDLPHYPWQGRPYQIQNRSRLIENRNHSNQHPLLGRAIKVPLATQIYEATIDERRLPYLRDHKLWGTVVVPGAVHLERLLGTVEQVLDSQVVALEDVFFPGAILLKEGDVYPYTLTLATDQGQTQKKGYLKAQIATTARESADDWRINLVASVVKDRLSIDNKDLSLPAVDESWTQVVKDGFYKQMEHFSYGLGPSFQWVDRLFHKNGEGLVTFQRPGSARSQDALSIHPTLIDAMLQVIVQVPRIGDQPLAEDSLFVPTTIGQVIRYQSPNLNQPLKCYVRRLPCDHPERQADVFLYDDRQLCLELRQVTIKPVRAVDLHIRDEKVQATSTYQVDWQPMPQNPTIESLESDQQGSWLLFSDQAIGPKWSQELEQLGDPCLLVYHEKGDRDRTDRLIDEAIARSDRNLKGVIYLWAIERSMETSSQKWIADHCQNVLEIARRCATQQGKEPRSFWIVTKGAQPVLQPCAQAGAEQAALWGLVRTIQNELPQVNCRLMDLDPKADDSLGIVDFLWRPNAESEIAFRDGRSYVPRVEAITLKPSDPKTPIRSEATYVISGGLGYLGLQIASALVSNGARYLVLLSRRQPGQIEEEQINHLRTQGAEVYALQVDITCKDDLSQVLRQVSLKVPAFKGVIHAAGVLADAPIERQDLEKLQKVLGPKIDGAQNLHSFMSDHDLDFFIHFSSVSTILGNPGQANYAAANAFLDAFVDVQRTAGTPSMSIAWGPWKGSGMAAGLEKEFQRRFGLFSLSALEGTSSFLDLVGRSIDRIMVMPHDPRLFSQAWTSRQAPKRLTSLINQADLEVESESAAPSPGEQMRTRLLNASDAAERMEIMRTAILGIVIEVLGIEEEEQNQIGPNTRLNELGVDSLLSMTLAEALQVHFDVAIPKNVVMLYPTFQQLVGYVATELEKELALNKV